MALSSILVMVLVFALEVGMILSIFLCWCLRVLFFKIRNQLYAHKNDKIMTFFAKNARIIIMISTSFSSAMYENDFYLNSR